MITNSPCHFCINDVPIGYYNEPNGHYDSQSGHYEGLGCYNGYCNGPSGRQIVQVATMVALVATMMAKEATIMAQIAAMMAQVATLMAQVPEGTKFFIIYMGKASRGPHQVSRA